MTARDPRSVPVSGAAGGRFAAVRRTFEDLFSEGADTGAAFAAFIDGEPVVDLVGGFADRGGERPWDERTLTCVYSAGKLALAMLVARAVGDGALDYERAAADDWPEFAEAGKAAITLGDVVSHQAGLVGFADPMPPAEWTDFAAIAARIAQMAPLFPPRSGSGYSPQISGFILGELLRRTIGRGVAQILREDFRDALGIDIHCGLGPAEIARSAAMQKPNRAGDLGEMTELKRIAFLKPWSATAGVTRETWMAAEIPSSNIHATARALAEIIHPLADKGRLRGREIIPPEVIAAATRVRISGADLVLPFEISWAAGFMQNAHGHFGPSRTAFGHAGHGGSAALFDPERRLSAAYVTGRMSPHLIGDPRAVKLFAALYDAI